MPFRQLNYKYEIYDYTAAALRRNRINPQERNLNTDINIDPTLICQREVFNLDDFQFSYFDMDLQESQ